MTDEAVSEETVERVARAICRAMDIDPDDGRAPPLSGWPSEAARAAIAALEHSPPSNPARAPLVEALRDAVATIAAVRATSVSDEWADSAAHFHDICGETLQRIDSAKIAALTTKAIAALSSPPPSSEAVTPEMCKAAVDHCMNGSGLQRIGDDVWRQFAEALTAMRNTSYPPSSEAPKPVQDDDAEWLRHWLGDKTDDFNPETVDRLERIAARLSTPKPQDELVERAAGGDSATSDRRAIRVEDLSEEELDAIRNARPAKA